MFNDDGPISAFRPPRPFRAPTLKKLRDMSQCHYHSFRDGLRCESPAGHPGQQHSARDKNGVLTTWWGGTLQKKLLGPAPEREAMVIVEDEVNKETADTVDRLRAATDPTATTITKLAIQLAQEKNHSLELARRLAAANTQIIEMEKVLKEVLQDASDTVSARVIRLRASLEVPDGQPK